MKKPIQEQNRSYRKGLLLGFTMAEISLLIIFSLLLATSFITTKNNKTIEMLKEENNKLVEVKKIINQAPHKINSDDFFQELKRLREISEKVTEIEKDNELLKEITKIVSEEKDTKGNLLDTVKKIHEDAVYLRDFKDGLTDEKLQKKSPKEIAQILNETQSSNLVEEKNLAISEASRLKGQLAHAQKKLLALGKGTEMPACWADPQNGKPEYIFQIDLTDHGFIVVDQKLTNRIQDQKSLPITIIRFNTVLNSKEFLKQTKPLYQWSVEHNCRFFVKTQDHTKENQKEIYKKMTRVLESHFYKYEAL